MSIGEIDSLPKYFGGAASPKVGSLKNPIERLPGNKNPETRIYGKKRAN